MIKQNWRNQTLLGVFSGITHNGEYFSVSFNFSSFTTDGFHTNSQDWFHDEWTFCRKKNNLFAWSASCNILKNSIFRKCCLSSSIWCIEKLCVFNIFQENLSWFRKQIYSGQCIIKNILSSWSLINICTSCIIMIIIKYTSWHYDHHKSMHLLSYTIMVIINLCIIMTIIQVYIFADRFSSLL